MSWGSGAAVFNVNGVGEDLPDNEVGLLFSEFLRERITANRVHVAGAG